MKLHLNLKGSKFGRWTCISPLKGKYSEWYWHCVCDCGGKGTPRQYHLLNGLSKSCGCLNREVLVACNTTHNSSLAYEFKPWCAMIKRCSKHPDYVGRGIAVCRQWLDFKTFLKDMGPRPKGYTIERINNNGNYEPENCRWATRKEQANNRRSNVLITFRGEVKTMTEWCCVLKIPYVKISQRIQRRGWEVEKAFITK